MAKSQVYITQSAQLDSNITTWSGFISAVSQIIDTFQTSIDDLQTLIENLNVAVNALDAKVTLLSSSIPQYVKTDVTQITIATHATQSYAHRIGVFSNYSDLYVYSNKLISGVYLNNTELTSVENIKTPILHIENPDQLGEVITVKTTNAQRANTAPSLYFSNVSTGYSDDDTSVKVSIKYSPVTRTHVTLPVSSTVTTIGRFSETLQTLNAQSTTIPELQTNTLLYDSLATASSRYANASIFTKTATVKASTPGSLITKK